MDTLAQKHDLLNGMSLSEITRRLLESLFNETMSDMAEEVAQGLGVSRNGYRLRTYTCSCGTLELKIPRFRKGSYFPDELLVRWSRTDTALAACVARMWVLGVSHRKVEKILKELGIESLSKSQVSRMVKLLDEEVTCLRESSLADMDARFLWLDATYFHKRDNGAPHSACVVTAVTLDVEGKRHVIGVDLVDSESEASWTEFLRSLKKRGLKGVRLVISDACPGLKAAIDKVFIGAAWQHCIAHLLKNVRTWCKHKKDGEVVVDCLRFAFRQKNEQLARSAYEKAVELLDHIDANLAERLEDVEEGALSYYQFPYNYHRWIRTNNVQERMNVELKRRSNVVQVFPDTNSLIRLVGAVCCDQNDAWSAGRRILFEENENALQEIKRVPDTKEKEGVIKLIEGMFEQLGKAA